MPVFISFDAAMMRIVSRKLRLSVFFIACSILTLSAQDVTGIWKGYFITESGEYYKLEFQVLQNGSSATTGVSYSYLDVRFYGKATMTGNFIKSSSTFRIREIKTVEVRSTLGGGTCIMNYNLSYSKSGKEEFLEGSYLGKYENRNYSATATGRWGDCGGGKVFLRKVNTTDFYVEPFLKNKVKARPVIVNEAPPPKKDTAAKTPPVTKPVLKPVSKPPVKKNNTNTNPAKPPVTKPITKNPVPVVTKTDTTRKVFAGNDTKPQPEVTVPAPGVIKNRTNELVKTFMISEEEITVKLFDNGEIDGDTISVYLDNKLVLSSKRLTASPLVVKIKMDEEDSEHELTMVAENLGSIPPNTSLMIVEAGEQRYEVRITSTEQKNAVVRFKYRKRK
ncbi:MAG: hypothetical protein FJY20_04190 [Bacteroidetes bacterium]|nr:hypothetical protein [Bacteroidota bacterium]